jgi:hypothetical protein
MTSWYDRRTFLRDCALWTMAMQGPMSLLDAQTGTRPPRFDGSDIEQGPLERGFVTPPDWAKSWAYWWWLNGDVSREGIVRDLDEMKQKGINGVLIFNAGGVKTERSVAFMSQEWRDSFRFAVQEASKRSIEVSLNLCCGWNAGGPWITAEEATQTLVYTKVQAKGSQMFSGTLAEPHHDDSYYRDVAVLAYRTEEASSKGQESSSPKTPSTVCQSNSVQDISNKMDSSGRLSWQIPEGEWLIVRFGHTVLMPASRSHIKLAQTIDKGYEIDPFRADTMEIHFMATAGKVIQDIKPWLGKGKTVQYFHIDSWEIGKPDWTPRMPIEFKLRRGYDLLPYLAALAEETVDAPDTTVRFMEDFNLTLGDLTVDNYYGKLTELSHRYDAGVHPESEGYQKSYVDSLKALGRSDIMMGEYWSRITQPDGYIHQLSPAQLRWHDSIKEAASAAHIYGHPIVQAEAFTVSRVEDWSEYPFALKDIGDRAFCAGLNRNVMSFYVHQPDLHALPGYAWPHVGMNIDRNVTWWSMSEAWFLYMARCQSLLRRGRFVADVCYFYGEEVPNYVPAKDYMTPPLPPGFDCDSISAEALLDRMTVAGGRVCLPGGISYRVLVMPYRSWSMPPAEIFLSEKDASPESGEGLPVGISAKVLRKIEALVENGATVLGPKPVRAPGLSHYPHSDQEVEELAFALWGDTTDKPSGQKNVGRGRVVWGKSIAEIFNQDETSPDFKCNGGSDATKLDYIHYSSSTAEIYFVSNQTLRTESVQCLFRVSGKQPELWDPVTGTMRLLPQFEDRHGQTAIPMEFAPRQSFFVLFRKSAQPGSSSRKSENNFLRTERMLEIGGAWQVSFDPKWGGPQKVTFDKLEDWTQRPEDGIRYYSGTATYRKTFDVQGEAKGSRIFLDLGRVECLAHVRLNGKDLGVIWTAPWSVEITQTVKPSGNLLEVDVVNLWPNRILGDAKLPAGERFTKTNVTPASTWTLLPSGLLGPVTLQKEI